MLVKVALLYGVLLQVSISKLLQTFVIFRHGARTPNSFFFEPDQYTEKPGDLTELGKRQVRELGEHLRQKYIDEDKLVSGEYNKHEVFVKSSVKLRTNESTYYLLQGLFPNKDIKDINVYYASIVRDLYYHAHDEKYCPFIVPLYQSLKHSEEYIKMEEYFQKHLYPGVVEKVNEGGRHKYTLDMLTIKQAKKIFDGYKCNEAHGKNNPKYSEEELNLFYKLNLWHLYQYKFGPELIQKLTNSPVFAEIHSFMKCISEKNKHLHSECPRLIIFSAHDSNIVPILKTLVPIGKSLEIS